MPQFVTSKDCTRVAWTWPRSTMALWEPLPCQRGHTDRCWCPLRSGWVARAHVGARQPIAVIRGYERANLQSDGHPAVILASVRPTLQGSNADQPEPACLVLADISGYAS